MKDKRKPLAIEIRQIVAESIENNRNYTECDLEISELLSKAIQQERDEWIKAVSEDSIMFLRNNLMDIINLNEVRRIRKVLRIEILEKMGCDASKIRRSLSKE